MDWARKDDRRQICWVKGPAGFGKSAIAQSIAEACDAEGTLAASFFFSRRHAERCSTKRFFPTIALQLAKSIPQTKDAIYQALSDDPLLPDEILRNQFQQLIVEPLMQLKETDTFPSVIVVDALDECDDDALVGEIIYLFTKTLNNCHLRLRVLITSRPQMHIESKMADVAISPIVHVCELQNFSAEQDIRLFVGNSLAEICEKRRQFMGDVKLPWPSNDAVDALARLASGHFVFASTVINFVDSKHSRPDRQLAHILNPAKQSDVAIYSSLDSLYLGIVSVFDYISEGNVVMDTIVLLFDPLSVHDLARLLSKPTGEVQLHLQELHSVFLVPDNLDEPVRSYHTSFRDFLMDPRRSSSHVINQQMHHGNISSFSLRLMTKELRRDPCGIRDSSKLNSEIPDLHHMCKDSIPGAVRYACRYWAVHLSKSIPNSTQLADLRAFASKSLLYWFETLSLLGHFDESTIPSLQMASTWLKGLSSPPSDLIELFYDAERFVLEFFDPISQSASHVYHSALPFVPSSTRLRNMYAHELSGGLMVVSGAPKLWGACRRVISTASPVRSVAFSPDGVYVASGTAKEGIQIWKTVNGVNFATLGGDDLSCSVTFSSDGMRVAVGERAGFVYMWDVETGLSLITKKAHRNAVNGVSFSPDSTCLASASSDTNIILWDPYTGHLLDSLSGHTGEVTSIVFSSDSERLASASNDTTIRLWDMASYQCLLTLAGHKDAVLCIAFSPSRTRIASGSADKSVRLWDALTGKCIATKTFHSKRVVAVKYTSDGSSVVSISDDLTVKCFDVMKGKSNSIWTFAQFYRKFFITSVPGWHMKVFALVPPALLDIKPTIDVFAFSDATTPFALTAEDYIILLRDLEPSCNTPFLSKTTANSALAFSRDGNYLAAGSPVRDIMICDTSVRDENWGTFATLEPDIIASAPNGTRFILSFAGDVSLVNANGSVVTQLCPSSLTTTWGAVFSPDSRLVAVTSHWTSTIRLFDSESGASIPGPTSRWGLFGMELKCVVFSPDGTLLACGDSECTPEVRSVPSGQRIARLKHNFKGEVTCIAFSPDKSCIAFGDSLGIVRCWNWSADIVSAGPELHHAKVTSIAFTPDGTRVASGSNDCSLQMWSLKSGSISWKASASKAISSMSFRCSSSGLRLLCRSENHSAEIWDFGEDEIDDQVIPHLSSHTADGCILADQAFDSEVFLRDEGWLFDGKTRMCWIPKMYRPTSNVFYVRRNRLTAVVDNVFVILDFSALRAH